MFCHVLLPTALDQTFTYQATPATPLPCVGQIVQVSFGKRTLWGAVWAISETFTPPETHSDTQSKTPKKRNAAPFEIKPLLAVHPFVLPRDLLTFLTKAARYTVAPLGSLLKMAMPTSDAFNKPPADFTPQNGALQQATLSDAQEKALTSLLAQTPEKKPLLLYGATGSGKTEVYLQWLQAIMKKSSAAQALVLLPEIALTPQWCGRFEKRFGFEPTLWHSALTPAGRRKAYQQITQGHARVIVGARSALFLPYQNLAAIVVDEEHDTTFKQADGVRYHARDMAVLRASLAQIPVLLSSATPSFETLYNVTCQKYNEVRLKARFRATPPRITATQAPTKNAHKEPLAEALLEKLQDTLARGEQSLLFLNRRGYAPFVSCKTCGGAALCPRCDKGLVFHQKSDFLLCHQCGFQSAPMCETCHSQTMLSLAGYGIEKLRDLVQEQLPKARIQLLSSDGMTRKRLEETVLAIETKQIDILIGTQMVAKGHHFPSLTFVGILEIDHALHHFDFRAHEHLYQLLEQVAGRAGRGALAGEVMLQTRHLDHPLIKAFQTQPYATWSQEALKERIDAHLPPQNRMAAVIVEGPSDQATRAFANHLASFIPHDMAQQQSIKCLGPIPAPIPKIRNRYRYRFLLHALKGHPHALLKKWLSAVKPPFSIRVQIDIDPYDFH